MSKTNIESLLASSNKQKPFRQFPNKYGKTISGKDVTMEKSTHNKSAVKCRKNVEVTSTNVMFPIVVECPQLGGQYRGL